MLWVVFPSERYVKHLWKGSDVFREHYVNQTWTDAWGHLGEELFSSPVAYLDLPARLSSSFLLVLLLQTPPFPSCIFSQKQQRFQGRAVIFATYCILISRTCLNMKLFLIQAFIPFDLLFSIAMFLSVLQCSWKYNQEGSVLTNF